MHSTPSHAPARTALVAALIVIGSTLAACERRPADPAAPSTTPSTGTTAPSTTPSTGTSPMPPASAASQ
jgi:hypothetical protein